MTALTIYKATMIKWVNTYTVGIGVLYQDHILTWKTKVGQMWNSRVIMIKIEDKKMWIKIIYKIAALLLGRYK